MLAEESVRRDATIVTSDASFIADEDGIAFWRGFDPSELGTEVFMARAVAQPGTEIPPHTHTVDTVAYLVSGRAVFKSGNDLEHVHVLEPGDWLFVPAGMVHVEATPDDVHAEFLYARDGKGGATTYLDEE